MSDLPHLGDKSGEIPWYKEKPEQLSLNDAVTRLRDEILQERLVVEMLRWSPADFQGGIDKMWEKWRYYLPDNQPPPKRPKVGMDRQKALDALDKLLRKLPVQEGGGDAGSEPAEGGRTRRGGPPAPARKRSTERGEGRAKLIAALTKHHQYADGGSLNLEPIGSNELAELAGVSKSTASAFFKSKLQGHVKYRALCRDSSGLARALKLLNGEFSPHHLYGSQPPGEHSRDADE